jgi:hypothetical protein
MPATPPLYPGWARRQKEIRQAAIEALDAAFGVR